MIPTDPIPEVIKHSVQLLLGDREAEAGELLRTIDVAALEAEKVRAKDEAREAALRTRVPAADVAEPVPKGGRNLSTRELMDVFVRDGFICRFAHCRRKTIIPPVLRILSVPFPDVLRYNKNWRGSHPLYWLYMASGDHVVPWSVSSSSDTGVNVVTACYWCNQVKSARRNEHLGWELSDAPVERGWDGLSDDYPRLLEVLLDRVPPENRAYFETWRRAVVDGRPV